MRDAKCLISGSRMAALAVAAYLAATATPLARSRPSGLLAGGDDATTAASDWYRHCNTSVWTFGLATRCCDVHPTSAEVDTSDVGPYGALMWPNRPGDVDYSTVPIPNGSIVYVPASHTALRKFVARFASLPGWDSR